MAAPLAGLTVLDLTSGPAGGLATMVLSDFGATVLRFTDPAYDELSRVPHARAWLRGKRNATSPLREAARDADILVITAPHGHAGADYDSLHRLNPRLIYAEITAFGDGGPEVPVTEPVVAARLGRMQSMSGILPEPGPRWAAVQVATHAAAQNLLTGILAALFDRQRTGTGQYVSTSLARSLIPYDQGASLARQMRDRTGAPEPDIDPALIMPTLNYHPVQCADGRWIQLGNLLPHLFASFMRVIGLEHELDNLPDERESVRDKILARMQEKPRDEWMALFVADGGIAAHPYQTAEEALDDPDMTANGHVVDLDGVRQLGPLARLTNTPARIGGPADEFASWPLAGAATADESVPLHGVTVLELATIIAAPLGASFLADLGARVIKVEPVGGDPYRNMGGGFGALRCNQGVESIGLDLKSARGRELVEQLISRADILIHNYRPGVPERLGIGFEQARAINPGIVYVSANGYGPDGPGAQRPSTHPIPGAALGGAVCQAGGEPTNLLGIDALREAARRLMRANEVNPDPNTAVVIATSALLGLIARLRTGEGQSVFVDMFIANAYANFDDFIAFDGKPPRPALGNELLGPHPLRRLYRCSEGWACLDIERRTDWHSFCVLTDAHHLAAHYPDPVGELGPKESAFLVDEIEQLFAAHPADHFEDLLVPAGVSCVVADRQNLSDFFYGECHAGSVFMTETDHPEGSRYFRHRPMVSFSRSRTRARGGVSGGQHTRALVAESGTPDEEIEALLAEGVLWHAAPVPPSHS